MSLRSRRSLAEARIALGSFDRFLLVYCAMFAAFGVASPFLPVLLHERGLGPSEIGAVLAAGTAIRLITGPVISRVADRLGNHRQTLTVFLAMAAVIAFGYSLPAGFAIFLLISVAHASALAPIVPIADAMTLAAAPGRFQYGWVRGGASAAFVLGSVAAGQVIQATSFGGIIWMNGTLPCARRRGRAATTAKCAGSACRATARQRPHLVCGARLLASHGAGGADSQ
jgi:MFS family permease